MRWEVTAIHPIEDRNDPQCPLWIKAESEDGRWRANIKWDGCVSLSETERGQVEDLHICNLDEFIDLLIDLRDNVESQVLM